MSGSGAWPARTAAPNGNNKFVILEVSAKLGRHYWRNPPAPAGDDAWERIPDRLGADPAELAESRELAGALRQAVSEVLSERQRHVFVAIIVDGVPLDALVAELGTTRNAIYKTMFDARRKIRAHLVANAPDEQPIPEEDPAMTAVPIAGQVKTRVLVVDDDPTVAEVVASYLRGAGLKPRHAADGKSALLLAAEWEPDLVVLDLMLPGIDGLEVCRRLREARDGQHPLPVIMLTALGEESDRVLGLETGADDYVTKPFSPRELALRVQAVLRRAGAAGAGAAAPPQPLRAGRFEVDMAARRIWRDGCELALTVREFDLLAFYITHPGRAFTRAELLEQVWGWSFGDLSTITVCVRRLREKIEDDPASPSQLQTVWGVGYRWEADLW